MAFFVTFPVSFVFLFGLCILSAECHFGCSVRIQRLGDLWLLQGHLPKKPSIDQSGRTESPTAHPHFPFFLSSTATGHRARFCIQTLVAFPPLVQAQSQIMLLVRTERERERRTTTSMHGTQDTVETHAVLGTWENSYNDTWWDSVDSIHLNYVMQACTVQNRPPCKLLEINVYMSFYNVAVESERDLVGMSIHHLTTRFSLCSNPQKAVNLAGEQLLKINVSRTPVPTLNAFVFICEITNLTWVGHRSRICIPTKTNRMV